MRAVLRQVSIALLTAALVVTGATAWMLWGTDWLAGRHLAGTVAEATTQWGLPADGLHAGTLRHDDPPVDPMPSTDATIFALMYVPRFGADWVYPVATGTDRATVLNVLGVGHYDGTAAPGARGNAGFAAHRTTYARPFHDMDKLRPGDLVVIRTKSAYLVYQVSTDPFIIDPDQIGILDSPPTTERVWHPGRVDGDSRVATLTACHPWYSLAQRIVVHASLLGWTSTSDGPPEEVLATVSRQPGMAELLARIGQQPELHSDYPGGG